MDAPIIAKADLAWKWLKPHLRSRPPQPKGGRPWRDDDRCVVGIVWVLVTGAQWREIPKELRMSYSTCWRRHRDWASDGIWDAAWAAALEQKRPRSGQTEIVDGMFVRARKWGISLAKPSLARE